MTLTIESIWPTFNSIIRSAESNEDLTVKELAINSGERILLERMLEIGKVPYELLSDVTDVTNNISENTATLPDDFLTLRTLWMKDSSDNYTLLGENSILSYDQLKVSKGSDFFNTDDEGIPSAFALKGLTIYFNSYFEAAGTDDIRIEYVKMPTALDIFDRIYYTVLTGTFAVDDEVTGGTTSATATVTAVGTDATGTYLKFDSSSLIGAFITAETLTGDTSTATGTSTTAIQKKPQELEWSARYRDIVATAWAVGYFYLTGDEEMGEKSVLLDRLIKQFSDIKTKSRTVLRISR